MNKDWAAVEHSQMVYYMWMLSLSFDELHHGHHLKQ
jgi:hypothetical protein